jgi:hypothetical protein
MKLKDYQSPRSEVRRTSVRASLLQSSTETRPTGKTDDNEEVDADARLRSAVRAMITNASLD